MVVYTLSACGHTGMLQLGKLIQGFVYRNGLGPDWFIWNALVDMYGKCGSLKEARRIFDGCLKRSLTSWNSMINCFALPGKSEKARNVFVEIIQCGCYDVRPDGVTFMGLLNAYFELMTTNFGNWPRIEHHRCLTNLLGRAGKFEEASEIVNRMKIELDGVFWGSLLIGSTINWL
ncbi:hypothetical protein Patl1_06902 [Pistacia atlantica]|uniref:Uncharacterized protein n=1 Tax=Pistacia atlantica TaxID=434234 RepID=A0ACC1ALX5_9ROSI|nr:hypothetical protein Patl1_06902 [Pistacia atlantica]